MKVLLCHNHYRHPGGEDQVFADEAKLLESRGCTVLRYVRNSRDLEKMSRLDSLRRAPWNGEVYGELRALLLREIPDVVHCTNTFPLLSPAVYDAARDAGVPLVQSLHNFRTICPNGLFLRQGTPCEDCLGKGVAWPGMWHRCYRDSHLASAALAALIVSQRRRRTKGRGPTLYLALSEFSRRKFVEAGFAPDRILVKPNFVDPDPGPGSGAEQTAIFVGRLSEEKGLGVLIDAWARMRGSLRLEIAGDGPLASEVAAAAERDDRITWLGPLTTDAVYDHVGRATCLILPSRCYENCPKTILEAYSKGTPVIASRRGAMQEYVRDGETGLLFTPGDASELAARVSQLSAQADVYQKMRVRARREYEDCYTADVNFKLLMRAYALAMGRPEEKLLPETADRTSSHDLAVAP